MKNMLREPLFHFFVLGLTVFGLFAILDDTPPPASVQTITVTLDDARRAAAEFEATWRQPPQPEEIDHLIAQFIREEIYVREAVALGLDEGDAIIRRRLQQKMEFLTEAGAQAVDPDDATLEAHMAAHPERFERAPLLAFEQILLGEEATQESLVTAKADLNRGRVPEAFGLPSLLPAALPASPPQVVASTFGTGFFEAMAELPVGQWAGPVRSSFGQHLVRVTDRRPGGTPRLAAIRERVVQDWRTTIAAQLREERFEAMRARYTVERPDASEVLGR